MKRKGLAKAKEKSLEECIIEFEQAFAKAWKSYAENFVKEVKGTLIAYTKTLNKINELMEEANDESGNIKE